MDLFRPPAPHRDPPTDQRCCRRPGRSCGRVPTTPAKTAASSGWSILVISAHSLRGGWEEVDPVNTSACPVPRVMGTGRFGRSAPFVKFLAKCANHPDPPLSGPRRHGPADDLAAGPGPHPPPGPPCSREPLAEPRHGPGSPPPRPASPATADHSHPHGPSAPQPLPEPVTWLTGTAPRAVVYAGRRAADRGPRRDLPGHRRQGNDEAAFFTRPDLRHVASDIR